MFALGSHLNPHQDPPLTHSVLPKGRSGHHQPVRRLSSTPQIPTSLGDRCYVLLGVPPGSTVCHPGSENLCRLLLLKGCISCSLTSAVVCALQAGIYWIILTDTFASSWVLLIIGLMEVIGFIYVYGMTKTKNYILTYFFCLPAKQHVIHIFC